MQGNTLRLVLAGAEAQRPRIEELGLERIVAVAGWEKPSIIFMTGDLVDPGTGAPDLGDQRVVTFAVAAIGFAATQPVVGGRRSVVSTHGEVIIPASPPSRPGRWRRPPTRRTQWRRWWLWRRQWRWWRKCRSWT